MRTIYVPLTLINLQDDGFHLLVEIVVFGQKILAVVDTGASRTVFDKTFIETHITDLESNQDEVHATALFTTASTLQSPIPKLKLGSLIIKDSEADAWDLEAVNQAHEGL